MNGNPTNPYQNKPNQPQAQPGQGYYQAPQGKAYPQGAQQGYPQQGQGMVYPGQMGGAPRPGMQLPPQGAPQQPGKKPQKVKIQKPKGDGFGRWVFMGIVLFLLLTIGGGVLGYNTAISARQSAANEQRIKAASQQFQLALQDIAAEKYENAKTRLEWVLKVDPNLPGAAEEYMKVQIQLSPKATATPMITSTPEPTPTADLRGEEDMLNAARSQAAAKEWRQTLETLKALRDKNLEFESLAVDSLYYITLRYLGIQEIGQGYLEPGIYKITLSEAFGPIDAEANNARISARNYLAGAGFWEINWEKAYNYYKDAATANPNMYDRSSGKTALERYVEASYQWGYQYINNNEPGTDQYCLARDYFNEALSKSALEFVAQTATAVQNACVPPTAVPEIPAFTGTDATPTLIIGGGDPPAPPTPENSGVGGEETSVAPPEVPPSP